MTQNIPQKTKLIMVILALFMPAFLVLPLVIWGGDTTPPAINKDLQAARLAPVGELTVGKPATDAAVAASGILFGQGTREQLQSLDEATLLSLFEGVPQFEVSKDKLQGGVKVIDLLTEDAAVFPSKGELRKLIASGGVSVNKEKVASPDDLITSAQLIADRYLLVQRGKKNYYLVLAK